MDQFFTPNTERNFWNSSLPSNFTNFFLSKVLKVSLKAFIIFSCLFSSSNSCSFTCFVIFNDYFTSLSSTNFYFSIDTGPT